MVFDSTLPFSAVIHTRLRLMSSLIQIASESIGDSVKERRHPDTLLFVDEHLQPVSEMWTEIGKLLFFHFLLSEFYSAKGLLYSLCLDMKLSEAFLIDGVNDAVLVISWMRETTLLILHGHIAALCFHISACKPTHNT